MKRNTYFKSLHIRRHLSISGVGMKAALGVGLAIPKTPPFVSMTGPPAPN